MSNACLFQLLVKGLAVFVATALFVRFLCDEYLMALKLRGLIRRRADKKTSGASRA